LKIESYFFGSNLLIDVSKQKAKLIPPDPKIKAKADFKKNLSQFPVYNSEELFTMFEKLPNIQYLNSLYLAATVAIYSNLRNLDRNTVFTRMFTIDAWPSILGTLKTITKNNNDTKHKVQLLNYMSLLFATA